jgi:sugar phosphate isomerase/epimerase
MTTGAGNDIERATELARKMVCEWGMSSNLGPLTFGRKDHEVFLGKELAYPAEYHTPKLPGLGEINWGRFMSVLSGTGYQGAVCVEVEDRAYEGSLENRKAALYQSCRYLRQFVA